MYREPCSVEYQEIGAKKQESRCKTQEGSFYELDA
ncbi:hypothetical protein GGE08_001319 [Muricauda sp. ARW1Y1]|jgi:hypothetical protein|nr:hypothetical protein [Muricauda sp. ARW1Y1]